MQFPKLYYKTTIPKVYFDQIFFFKNQSWKNPVFIWDLPIRHSVFHSSNLWILEGQVCSVYGWGLFTQNAAKGTHRFTVQEVVLKNPSCCKVFYPTRIDTKDPRYKYIMCAGSLSSLKFWKRWEFSFCPVKFVVFEKATKVCVFFARV